MKKNSKTTFVTVNLGTNRASSRKLFIQKQLLLLLIPNGVLHFRWDKNSKTTFVTVNLN